METTKRSAELERKRRAYVQLMDGQDAILARQKLTNPWAQGRRAIWTIREHIEQAHAYGDTDYPYAIY